MRFNSLLLLILLVNICYADNSQMNVSLQRIDYILQKTYPLINLAEKQQDKQSRVRFQFDRLRTDIAKIQAGIKAQIHRVTIEPRLVKPLAGDYLKADPHS